MKYSDCFLAASACKLSKLWKSGLLYNSKSSVALCSFKRKKTVAYYFLLRYKIFTFFLRGGI